jgi:thiol-disulfide isomerase/thioredoxin
MSLERITDNNYAAFMGYEKAVLVLSMTWCGPCRRYKPVLSSVAKDMSDVKFGVADLDEGHLIKLKRDFPEPKYIPTTILLRAGKEVYRFDGAQLDSEKLSVIVKENLM